MRVRVDAGRCMGHAMCESLAGEVYEVTDDGFNEMGEFEVPEELRAVAVRGASACPEGAIALTGEGTDR
ncbi:ferredoxin [Streptomyces boncukensis]|uniref:Ferredoxin n=1 Tax=Streptomyces boncukensis TaxID=2711219 RepID=A0A6G4X6D6_9ACTN|nr:ferredoxin [Streptomyces boncukensis]